MIRADIELVLQQLPELTSNGVGIWRNHNERLTPEELARKRREQRDELLAAEIECSAAEAWLRTVVRTKSVNRRHSSYGYKHFAERTAPDGYVSNGALIAAAIHLGFELRLLPGNPNVLLNISERSLRRVA